MDRRGRHDQVTARTSFSMMAPGCLQLGQTNPVVGVRSFARFFSAVMRDPRVVAGATAPMEMAVTCPPKPTHKNTPDAAAVAAFLIGSDFSVRCLWKSIRHLGQRTISECRHSEHAPKVAATGD
jgi:hypothetical protein